MSLTLSTGEWDFELTLTGPKFDPPKTFTVDLFLFNDHVFNEQQGMDWENEPPLVKYKAAQRLVCDYLDLERGSLSPGDAYVIMCELLNARGEVKKKADPSGESFNSAASTGSTSSSATDAPASTSTSTAT